MRHHSEIREFLGSRRAKITPEQATTGQASGGDRHLKFYEVRDNLRTRHGLGVGARKPDNGLSAACQQADRAAHHETTGCRT
jgi:hypothetical protein